MLIAWKQNTIEQPIGNQAPSEGIIYWPKPLAVSSDNASLLMYYNEDDLFNVMITNNFNILSTTPFALFLDTVTKSYLNLSATGSGTSGTTTITASGSVANLVQIGEKLRIGGTDIYTVANVVTTTITTVETLSTTYTAGSALALDRVSQWTDVSGNNRNLSQSTTAKKPVQAPNMLNSEAVLIFDGANTLSGGSAFYTIPNGANTVFVVGKINAETGTAQRYAAMNSGSAAVFKWLITSSSSSGLVLYANDAAGTGVSKSGLTNTNYQILRGYRTGTTVQVASNNGTSSNNTNGANVSDIASFYVGSNEDTNRYLTGAIAALIIYDRALSAQEIINVNTWLSARFAITIS